MDIIFASDKLGKLCNSAVELKKKFGEKKAKKIGQRLYELRAAQILADVSYLPPTRCHLLTGDLAGKFAVDTVHPFRLIFEPAHHPIPHLPDGGIDRSQVTVVRIIDVDRNYHE